MATVETTCGKVEGGEDAGLACFAGIPYARPPLGQLRFRAPRPCEPWAGVREATGFGPWAPQDPSGGGLEAPPPGGQSEDCLTVNVWTPAVDGARRPVMVWIHGGAFVGGSAGAPLYRGARLAARGDVVVVTVNYRLGILGFLAHPDLADADAYGAAGNWGLLDQVAALEWVQENIASFGGDPGNVTLFGESAGGMSVADLLTVPAAAGLFRRAIVQSGPPNATTMERAEARAASVLGRLGLDRPEGLRDVPLAALLEAQSELLAERLRGLPLVPVVDGAGLPEPPLDAIAGGAAASVPLLIGTNRDEAKFFMIADPKNRHPDETVLRRRIARAFEVNDLGLEAGDVIERYRSARAGRGDPVDPRELWSAIETDRVFRIGSVRAAEAQAGHQASTFAYLFNWESPAMHGALGSCHALEIPFVLGTFDAPDMGRFAGTGPAVDALSATIMDAWLAFARCGDPTHAGTGPWPAYDASRRATMVLGPSLGVEEAPFEDERRVWDGQALD